MNKWLQQNDRSRKQTAFQRQTPAVELHLRAVLDHNPAVCFLKDRRGRYLYVNRQFENKFNLDRRGVIGKSDTQIFPAKQAAQFRANDLKVLRDGQPVEFEEKARYRDGVHTSLVSKFPLRDVDGKIYALCGIATDITMRTRAEKSLQELSAKIILLQEEERRRISRRLHDETGQALTAISVMLASLKNNGAAGSKSFVKKITDTQRLLCRTMDSIYRVARELRPSVLDELGLLPALRSHIRYFSESTGLQVNLRGDPGVEKLDSGKKTMLFRVAQESLAHAARHARRINRVDISLRKSGTNFCMEIANKGESFRYATNCSERKQSLGLLGMRERVRLANGEFMVLPRPGEGTTMRVSIPFDGHLAKPHCRTQWQGIAG